MSTYSCPQMAGTGITLQGVTSGYAQERRYLVFSNYQKKRIQPGSGPSPLDLESEHKSDTAPPTSHPTPYPQDTSVTAVARAHYPSCRPGSPRPKGASFTVKLNSSEPQSASLSCSLQPTDKERCYGDIPNMLTAKWKALPRDEAGRLNFGLLSINCELFFKIILVLLDLPF